MKQPKNIPVIELFKQFCKERHVEDKGRNYDMLQEIYAKTELFDLSFVPYDNNPVLFYNKTLNTVKIYKEVFKNLSLPFESQFIKAIIDWENDTEDSEPAKECVFIREYSPFTLTGTVWYYFDDSSINMPFTIYTEEGKLALDITGLLEAFEGAKDEDLKHLISFPIHSIIKAVKCLTNLPKHSVATDTPKKAEYYTRKHSSTIKVVKPIYYVLEKKEEKNPVQFKRINPLGHCCFDHSFHVVGHWRRISPHTYGKNRSGEYIVEGMTWVKEHVRGEGDLVKKIRVVK